MPYPNWKQIYAIKRKNEERLLKVNPHLDNSSGIYFLTRTENGISYFYIGQAVKILDRMCSHLTGYQHIDISLKKRGFACEGDETAWNLNFIKYPKEKLDEMEQYWIAEYMRKGWQARYNKTSGSQGTGKEKINEFKPAKGYRDGIVQGKINLARELRHIIDTHLTVTIRKPSKISEKAFDKFNALLDVENYKESENNEQSGEKKE